ncbi:MAG TPA: hypothetical protein VIY56_01990 [Vicinamibacterales bacterium]
MSARAEFNLSAASGLIAGAVSADGVFFAWRNPPTRLEGAASVTNERAQRIKMLCCQLRTVTGFPAAQEVAISAHYVSVFGSPVADYTGGTDLSDQAAGTDAIRRLGADPGPKPHQTSVAQTGNIRIATTQALAHAGSPTIKTHGFSRNSYFELAAASTIQEGGCDLIWTPSPEGSAHDKGIVLQAGTGFILKFPIALGATGTVRAFVEVFWEEA